MKIKEALIIYYDQNCKFEAQILENDTNFYFYANYFLHFKLQDQVFNQVLVLKDFQNEGIKLKIKEFNFDYLEYNQYQKSNKSILEMINETEIQMEKAQMCLKQKQSQNYYYDACIQAKKMCQQQYMLTFQSTNFMLEYNMNLLRKGLEMLQNMQLAQRYQKKMKVY
ncbi:hypothetical protein PPERSA_02631 [Pseudocohnilembus persalinus]|uniref:Uncharacterized protein n=1 Tax=Pseudocohnilembus persalinus TaxID=266149 RepID=A0A0V0R5J6_PSEPJ|nr:hypothetical protein PPERSA_02631 [Pseudocohnilembus persalinus]|eukprot:KRX09759.1 hypothetical protein PPERSA_02631 [Pseudocohnilembus persalinus]